MILLRIFYHIVKFLLIQLLSRSDCRSGWLQASKVHENGVSGGVPERSFKVSLLRSRVFGTSFLDTRGVK